MHNYVCLNLALHDIFVLIMRELAACYTYDFKTSTPKRFVFAQWMLFEIKFDSVNRLIYRRLSCRIKVICVIQILFFYYETMIEQCSSPVVVQYFLCILFSLLACQKVLQAGQGLKFTRSNVRTFLPRLQYQSLSTVH